MRRMKVEVGVQVQKTVLGACMKSAADVLWVDEHFAASQQVEEIGKLFTHEHVVQKSRDIRVAIEGRQLAFVTEHIVA